MHDIEHYRRKLPTNKHYLDDELEEHAHIMEEISRQTGLLNKQAILAKEELARTDARIAADMKHRYEKATVAEITGLVVRDADHRRAFTAWLNADAEHREWSDLAKAWHGKGYDIKALGELYANSYYALTRTSVSAPRSRRDTDYEETKAAMRGASGRVRLK